MAFHVMGLLLFVLSMAGHSSGATYCLCNGGLSDSVLQQNIDYACGSGADCTPIHQGGSCFTPNTVKDHCNYAVNSYFQKKGQVSGSCDFKGTAIPSANPPSPTSGCVYPSSSSGGGTPTIPGTGTGTGTGTGSTVPGSPFPVGLGPTGGDNNPDGNRSGRLQESSNFLYSLTLGLLFSSFVWLRV